MSWLIALPGSLPQLFPFYIFICFPLLQSAALLTSSNPSLMHFMTPSPYHASDRIQGSSSSALTASGRTYDAKLVQREMMRLGTLAHNIPSAAMHTLSSQASHISLASTVTLVPDSGSSKTTGMPTASHALGHGHGGSTALGVGVGGNDNWAQLHVHVLPLFNHERLQSPM